LLPFRIVARLPSDVTWLFGAVPFVSRDTLPRWTSFLMINSCLMHSMFRWRHRCPKVACTLRTVKGLHEEGQTKRVAVRNQRRFRVRPTRQCRQECAEYSRNSDDMWLCRPFVGRGRRSSLTFLHWMATSSDYWRPQNSSHRLMWTNKAPAPQTLGGDRAISKARPGTNGV
jgi:hypothetical protein